MVELRDYQIEAVTNTINYLKNKSGNPLIGMPGGSGKSWVIAGIIESLISQNLFVRILKLVHTKELIVQNKEKLQLLLPSCDLGILSAGLKSYQTVNQVVFGGIGTVVKRAKEIGHIDYVIVDEAHSISDNEQSSYQKTFSILKEINPLIKIIGLTATPFKMGKGSLIDKLTFHDFSHNMTTWQEFNKLISQGYLCNLISRLPENIINTSDVSIQKGDFNITELQQAVLKNDVTTKAVKEAIKLGVSRKKWIVFCAGVEHAIQVKDMLNILGVKTTVVHSDSGKDRDTAINGFKSGEYQAITNNNLLTTGFDCPEIDLIVMLRPTMSPNLWVQMLSRGTRPHISKPEGCLVLDFAYNTQRLGCVNDVIIPKKKGTKAGETPVKLCPACQVYNHLSARVCIACGVEFVIKQNIKRFASADELIRTEENIPRWVDVVKVSYVPMGNSERNFLMIWYICKGIKIKENLMFGKVSAIVHRNTRNWWWSRWFPIEKTNSMSMPNNAQEAYKLVYKIKTPSRVEYMLVKNKPKILKYEFVVNGERKIIE